MVHRVIAATLVVLGWPSCSFGLALAAPPAVAPASPFKSTIALDATPGTLSATAPEVLQIYSENKGQSAWSVEQANALISGLRAADKNDIQPLFVFARS